ncbi:hypothetical protein L7F22_042102 [Adiantum nelumboides]|nr:hypothetical protein [Adiantum nelumboides]
MSDNVRGTLLQVTKRKFENLKAEKHRFDEQHEKSLKNAKHQENAVERLNAFIEEIEEMELIDEYDCHPDFKLVNEILRQAQYDTAITEKIIQGWQERLEQRLIQYGRRFDCALLFNDLVMKCVESGTSDSQEDGKKNEKVARKEMYEQRKEWESLAFSQPTIDVQRINFYLEEIFETSDKPEKAGCEST